MDNQKSAVYFRDILCFRRSDLTLQGFSDVDLGGDLDNRKSTIGYFFKLGGTTVSCKSKLQRRVSISTTEAEYVVISQAAKEMIWLQNFLNELGSKMMLHCLVTVRVLYVMLRISSSILDASIFS